jgi:hypothetical protein
MGYYQSLVEEKHNDKKSAGALWVKYQKCVCNRIPREKPMKAKK